MIKIDDNTFVSEESLKDFLSDMRKYLKQQEEINDISQRLRNSLPPESETPNQMAARLPAEKALRKREEHITRCMASAASIFSRCCFYLEERNNKSDSL